MTSKPLTEFLEPEQLALSKAGGAKLVHKIRMLSENNPGMVVVKVDMRNAHYEVFQAALLEALEREPTLRHMAWPGTRLPARQATQA